MENVIIPCLGKVLKRETVLKDESVVIVAPNSESGKRFGEEVEKKVKQVTSDVRVTAGTGECILKERDAVFIIAGNLTNNDCVRYLYYKSFLITDLCYPGPGGYEVRTILDPFGKGKNILFIGFSDEEGFQKGLECFLNQLEIAGSTVPFLKVVSYTRLPVTKKTFLQLCESKEPDNINLMPSAHVNNWYMKAWLAYATGEQQYADDYIRAWKKLLAFAEKNPDKPGLDSSTSIGMSAHSGSFWIAVHSGIIPPDLLEDIETVLYRWMCSNYGVDHANSYKDPAVPPHNIVMFAALGCIYLSEYFIKTYGMNDTLEQVAEIAKRAFSYYSAGNWRPYCDDSSYSLSVSLPLAVAYSFFEDRHTFLNTSFKDAKDFILSMHMPSGFIPSIGDGGVAKLASLVCKVYAYYYRDGQIQALCDAEPDQSLLDMTGFVLPMRAFCGYPVEPRTIDNDDLRVLPLNRWHYEASAKKSEEGKTVPYEKAYDKISFRKFREGCACCDKNCKKDWDYFLLDGLGIETHCKNNTLAVLDLSINGVSCFVEESGYRWPDRESCSTVTISRNGYSGKTPELASLDQLTQTDETIYIKSTVPGFNGVDWTREFFIVYGMGAVIHDTFTAYQQDDYVFYSHFRIPARMEVQDKSIFGLRSSGGCDQYLQRTGTYASIDIGVSTEIIDIGAKKFENGDMGEPWYKKPDRPTGMDMWRERYGSDEAIITKYTSFIGAKMKKGDTISYTHLLQVSDPTWDSAYFDQVGQISSVVFPAGEDDFIDYTLPFTPALFGQGDTLPVSSTDNTGLMTLRRHTIPETELKGYTMTRKGNVLVYEGSTIRYYQNDGTLKLEHTVPGPIRSVAAMDLNDNDAILAVGYDNKNIRVMNSDGKLLWETVTVRQPTMLCGWETKYPKVFSLCFVKIDHSYRLFAGCGDNHVKLYDSEGVIINTIFADYRIIDHMIAEDYDHDGNIEVLAYASDEASSGNFYIYDDMLNIKYRASAGGWLYTVKSIGYTRMDEKGYFAVGVNTNQTLLLFELAGGKLSRLFSKDVAGANTAACIDPVSKTVYAGSDKGYVKAFDLAGNELYSCYAGMPIYNLVLQNGYLYAASDYSIKQMDLQCKITGTVNMNSKIVGIERKGDQLLIVCENGFYTVD